MDLKALCEPFAPNEIEWRIGQSGKNAKGVWAKVLAYVTNRAIMQRLDDVCGPENWRNEYRYERDGAVLCGISIYVRVPDKDAEWVTKWDGAENTGVEAVKGGLSNAMKRAAVQWGIGRYLYDLEEGWAAISDNGEHYVGKNDKKEMPAFRWSPPKLPSWAMPKWDEAKPRLTPEQRAAVAAPLNEDDVRGTGKGTGNAAPPRARRDPFANSVARAKNTEVRGKRLDAHTTEELRTMQDALRAEGNAKHKTLLADVVLVLSERNDDDPDANVARMHAAEDKQQAGLEALMT